MNQEFIKACELKMKEGQAIYGTFDPKTDTRDLCVEIQEECEDIANYAEMLWRKVELLKSKQKKL